MEFHQFSGRRTLHPGAVPCIFKCWEGVPHLKSIPKPTRPLNALQLARFCKPMAQSSSAEHCESDDICVTSEDVVADKKAPCTSSFEHLKKEIEELKNKIKLLTVENHRLETALHNSEFSIENVKDCDVCFYTGFPNREVFKSLLKYVNPGPNGENLVNVRQTSSSHQNTGTKIGRPRKLSVENQFFLFLCRVRLGLFERDLSYRFSVSVTTVSNTVVSWSNFLYLRLGSINIWPSKQVVINTMPDSFKDKYPDTRVIIDATEIKIEMPSSLMLKSQSYSNYKSTNTLKGLIGITPAGNISFVSQLYTGSISDRELTIRSSILKNSFDPGDRVLADKGFEIQDLLDQINVKLNIPPFLGQQGQMTDDDVFETQQIAAERIHVERAINKVKNFHIFDSVIPMSLTGSINQIWTVCAILTLFQNPIISVPN
ncbi:uncharacterized protein [Ptychodera flava]|uniref:uncharacterized protein n=1 Tax=Ptychodera flava TaxID=63121 RepID=UPI00396A471C